MTIGMRHDDSPSLHSSSRKRSTPASTIGDSNSHRPPTRHGKTPVDINFSQDSRDASENEIRNDKISSGQPPTYIY